MSFISLIDFWRYRLKKQGKTCVVRPCHEFKAKALTDLVLGRLPTPNLMILEPPRIGKTDLGVKSFVPWSGSYFPDSEFIMGGYNRDLPEESLADIRDTFAQPWYRQMVASDWGVRIKMRGDKITGKADYFRTQDDGCYKAVGRGGGATGFGAGKLRPEFGGAIVCFPYSQKIATEDGDIPIGDIVRYKMSVRIYSQNMNTGKIELQPIDRYLENQGSSIVEIGMSNGKKIQCTPDHKIYTKNRGYIEAINLRRSDVLVELTSNSLHCASLYSHLARDISDGVVYIADKINLLFRKLFCPIYPGVDSTSFFGYFRPSFTYFNLPDGAPSNSVFFGDRAGRPFIQNDGDCIDSGQFGSRPFFISGEGPMPFCVSNVFSPRAVLKIFKAIVLRVAIQMPDLLPDWPWAKKSPRYHGVEIHAEKFSSDTALENPISPLPPGGVCFQHPLFQYVTRLVRPMNNPLLAFCSAKIRNAISRITGRIHPNFIRFIGHETSTYCLTIRGNHNMFVGENQYILASNCDDPLKAQEAQSNAAMKEANVWIENTLQSRRNRLEDPLTPMILIMQRLHPNDPAGYLLKTQRHRWTVIQIPAHDEHWNSIWPEKISVDELKHMRDFNPDLYYSQYMQAPSDDGYVIFRPEWWRVWDNRAEVEKRITHKFIVADTAFKAKDSADFSVFQCWGCEGTSGMYLLDQIRGKWEFPELLKEATKFKDKHIARKMGVTPATEFWIEDKASGTSLVQTLRRNGVNAREWKPSKKTSPDKAGRAKACTDSIGNGRVYIPDPDLPDYRWTDIYVAEHTAFTSDDSHVNDDMVDCTTMAISIWKERGGGTGPLPSYNTEKRLKNVKAHIYTL